MTMHTRTDTFFERCVTAFLSRLDFFGSPGNLTVLSCFKAERVCVLRLLGKLPVLINKFYAAGGLSYRHAVLPAARRKGTGSEE